MKIVIAPDSFSEALSAPEATDAIANGLLAAQPDAELIRIPMADGGEGTLAILVEAAGGEVREVPIRGPLMEPVTARIGLIDGGATAIVEIAQACGLSLVPPDQRDPMRTSSYGAGQLIQAALDAGARKIIVTLGDSATVDGGCGMASALGVVLTGYEGEASGLTGDEVAQIAQVNLAEIDPRIQKTEIIAAADVTNPLHGPHGAARIYGPQKGAGPDQVEHLEQNLQHLAGLMELATGQDRSQQPGAGAAGGLGFGLVAFLGATLRSGFDLVAEAVGLDAALSTADLVITGEGCLDRQTPDGKVVAGVGRLAHGHGLRAVALVGRVEPAGEAANQPAPAGITQVIPIAPADTPLAEAIGSCGANLTRAAQDLLKTT